MPEGIFLDNDVVLKACAYRYHDEVVAATTLHGNPPAMLGIARFTLRSRLSRPCGIADREGATVALDQLLAKVSLLNPTQSEIDLAAELEERAAAHALEFDTGESQLVAILLLRGKALLVTGDKRAIIALSSMVLTEVRGRIASFEQLVIILLAKHQHDEVRQRVCVEPDADKAMTACFACSTPSVSVEDILAGLTSYTEHLRKGTGDMLVADAKLLTVVS